MTASSSFATHTTTGGQGTANILFKSKGEKISVENLIEKVRGAKCRQQLKNRLRMQVNIFIIIIFVLLFTHSVATVNNSVLLINERTFR